MWDYVVYNFMIDENRRDNIYWKLDKNEVFSVTSAWRCLPQKDHKVCWAYLTWSISNIPKLFLFYA